MTRYKDILTLVSLTTNQTDDGSLVHDRQERDVFANRYEIGAATYVAARSVGLRADAEFQIRTVDYAGEQVAVYDGKEYDVERVSDTGEFTRLTLARKLSNV